MARPPSLRLDVRQPVPWRKAPALLFGDRQRRRREWALAGGAVALGGMATVVLAIGLLHGDPFAGDPTEVAAAGPPPRARDFPLIEPPAPSPFVPPSAPAPSPPEAATPPPAATPPARPLQSKATPAMPVSPAPAPSPPEASPSAPATPPAAVATTAAETAPPATPAAPHFLQLGTYRHRSNAVADQAHFANLGIETVILRRGDYFVLRLPPFPDRQSTEREEERLRGLGIDCLYIGPRR